MVLLKRANHPLRPYPILVQSIEDTIQFMNMRAETQEQDQSTRVLYHLCSMIIQILRSPPLPISFPTLADGPSVSSFSSRTRQPSPAAFASIFLGISVAMMLFGSVTFLIGFFLMPLVIGLVMLFYFIGMIYNLSELGRAILWPGCPPNSSFPPGWR